MSDYCTTDAVNKTVSGVFTLKYPRNAEILD